MTRFTLAILPNGKAIITTHEPLPSSAIEYIRDTFAQWLEDTDSRLIIMAETRTVVVNEIELDLDIPGA